MLFVLGNYQVVRLGPNRFGQYHTRRDGRNRYAFGRRRRLTFDDGDPSATPRHRCPSSAKRSLPSTRTRVRSWVPKRRPFGMRGVHGWFRPVLRSMAIGRSLPFNTATSS
ncbi:hypothetical protein NJ7G_0564 [Natrinema sp. J7-2]|nr:hypothetical protein NJ7G_0564 [Natrinema sp. J7-2]